MVGQVGWQALVESTVAGLGYELVELERSARGLLRVFIDKMPGDPSGEFITVDDCEKVTRQLQYLLEVEGVPYERLEVSSPGLDRPLRKPADYQRFAGLEVDITLKQPFQNRKKFKGVLEADGDPQTVFQASPVLVEASHEHAARFEAFVHLFCGGLATGTWLARSRRLERAGEASERSGGPLPAASAPAEGEPLLPFTGSVPRGRGVARLRNPVGAPSAMQR